jgi:Holliday junction resolvasome RuvABC endonuclease subunit
MNISILTIDPGTRFWGVSVFSGRNISASFVKNLSTKDSPKNRVTKVKHVFHTLCKKYSPHILVIKKPYEFWKKQSGHLENIIEEIKRLARKEKIKVVEISPKTMRKTLCQDELAPKKKIIEIIGCFYPELKAYLEGGQKYNSVYWWRMTNSIALGICYLRSRENCKISH